MVYGLKNNSGPMDYGLWTKNNPGPMAYGLWTKKQPWSCGIWSMD